MITCNKNLLLADNPLFVFFKIETMSSINPILKKTDDIPTIQITDIVHLSKITNPAMNPKKN